MEARPPRESGGGSLFRGGLRPLFHRRAQRNRPGQHAAARVTAEKRRDAPWREMVRRSVFHPLSQFSVSWRAGCTGRHPRDDARSTLRGQPRRYPAGRRSRRGRQDRAATGKLLPPRGWPTGPAAVLARIDSETHLPKPPYLATNPVAGFGLWHGSCYIPVGEVLSKSVDPADRGEHP